MTFDELPLGAYFTTPHQTTRIKEKINDTHFQFVGTTQTMSYNSNRNTMVCKKCKVILPDSVSLFCEEHDENFRTTKKPEKI